MNSQAEEKTKTTHLGKIKPGEQSIFCSRSCTPSCGGKSGAAGHTGRAFIKRIATHGDFLLLSGVSDRPSNEILIYRPGFGDFYCVTLPFGLNGEEVNIHFGKDPGEIIVVSKEEIAAFLLIPCKNPAKKAESTKSAKNKLAQELDRSLSIGVAIRLPILPEGENIATKILSRASAGRLYLLSHKTDTFPANFQWNLTVLSYSLLLPNVEWELCRNFDREAEKELTRRTKKIESLDLTKDSFPLPTEGEILSFDVASNGFLIMLRSRSPTGPGHREREKELVWFDPEKWEELFSVRLGTGGFDLIVIDALDQIVVKGPRRRENVAAGAGLIGLLAYMEPYVRSAERLDEVYSLFSPDGKAKADIKVETKKIRYPSHTLERHFFAPNENLLLAGFDPYRETTIFYDRPDRLVSRFSFLL